MAALLQSDDFRRIVLERIPLIDVRAPVEFAKGAFVNAVNLPLMNDEERHLVGIEYKHKGNESAVLLGHKLVSGEVKEQRIQRWLEFKKEYPDAMLYCFRGGQRSKISQEWLAERGCDIVRLKGGYKAFRNYLMEETQNSVKLFEPLVIGGHTGAGKTIFLNRLENAVDLEALANHRGSAFGKRTTPQPTQINFENALAYELITKTAQGHSHLLFEDEGKFVGRVYLPPVLAEYLSNAPLIILQAPLQQRVDTTFEEYVSSAHEEYTTLYGQEGLHRWYTDMHDAMKKIQKRLGMQRYMRACEIFDSAYAVLKNQNDNEAFKEWVEYLLVNYYDPMYAYQIEKNTPRIVFSGDADACREYISTHTSRKL